MATAGQLKFLQSTTSLQTAIQGPATAWLESMRTSPSWCDVHLTLRPPFLLIATQAGFPVTDFWFVPETAALQRTLSDISTQYNIGPLPKATSVDAVVLSRPGLAPFVFVPVGRTCSAWLKALTSTEEHPDVGGNRSSRLQVMLENQRLQHQARHAKLEESHRLLLATCEKLEAEVKRLAEGNAQLRVTGEAAERAAAELVQLRALELDHLRHLLVKKQSEITRLETRVLAHQENQQRRELTLQMALQDVASMRERYTTLRDDIEDQARLGGDKTVLQLASKRYRLQKFILENRRLRRELISAVENFHHVRQKAEAKRTEFEEMLSFDPMFDLLRNMAELASAKLFLKENFGDLPTAEKQKINENIRILERDIVLKEAEARTLYIRWRSSLVSRQLDVACGNHTDEQDVAFVRKILDRYRWLLERSEAASANIPWVALATEGTHNSYVNLSWLLSKRLLPTLTLGGLEETAEEKD